jgi:hypothetical protein
MSYPAIVEVNPSKDGLRFPTQRQVEAILQDLDTDNQGRTDVSSYELVSTYFPTESILSTELEIYAVQNPFDYGMTYFHTLSTEPRTVSRATDISVQKTTWSGAHFKEAARWGEAEILHLASMAPKLRPLTIQSEVSAAIVAMRDRRLRRMEWLAAQLLTTGKISVSKNLPDNPEGVSYEVDYMLDSPTITLAAQWDVKDGSGNTPDAADPIRFFHELKDNLRTSGQPYRVKEVIVGPEFVKVLRENTVFWDTWYKYNLTDTTREKRPVYFYADEFVVNAFKAMTGVDVRVYDKGYFDADGTYHSFIPYGHMTIVLDGPGQFGKFTFTAHVHTDSESGNIRLGTGPYALVNNQLKRANPYYEIFHGFHGLPRLLDYNPKTLKCHRLKFVQYATPVI